MSIFKKIYKKTDLEAIKEIFFSYNKLGYLVINYLYFANTISNGIIGKKKLNKDYLTSLEKCDFLLPDGIALKLYVKKYFGFNLQNLNGTDFSEKIIQNIDLKNTNFILYGAKKDVIKKAVENIKIKYGIDIFYFQDGYSDFDFSKLKNIDKSKINILMVGLGTPKQEIWALNNLENIKKYGLLVFTQGGTFDFWAGNEKRAPVFFIKLNIEWLWRFIINPKKNFKKVINSFYIFYFLIIKSIK